MPPDEIQPLVFRHPVSAASHLLFAAWAGYAAAVLVRLARGDAGRRGAVVVFGVSVVALYGASGVYHAAPAGAPRVVEVFRLLDLSAIHVLIAGTCTAMAACLGGGWRRGLMAASWGLAVAGVVAKWALPLPAYPLTVGLYVGSAGVGLAALGALGRSVGAGGVAWVVGGAAVYAVGAACEVARWPEPWPGVIGPHEILHVCDMGGTACHLVFVARYVVGGAGRG